MHFFSSRVFAVTAIAITVFLSTVITSASLAAEFELVSLPETSKTTVWPTQDWQRSPPPASIDVRWLQNNGDFVMSPQSSEQYGTTHVLLVAHKGKLVFERYAPGYQCDGIMHSMSIAKMMGAVLAGVMESDGLIDISKPAEIPQWHSEPDDPRSQITAEQILQMTNGQEWEEVGDFLELAFGSGHEDLAAYAYNKPLAYAPGTHFQYSDGAPGLISYILRIKNNWGSQEVGSYIQERILNRIDMRASEPEFDKYGTWYGSSGMRWSPCDLARFSLFLLRDGVWNDERILPERWVERMRTPSVASLRPESDLLKAYGAGYGLTSFAYDLDVEASPIKVDAFGHLGFGGHVLRIVPSKDLIVMFLGVHAFEQQHVERLNLTKAISDLFPDVTR